MGRKDGTKAQKEARFAICFELVGWITRFGRLDVHSRFCGSGCGCDEYLWGALYGVIGVYLDAVL